MKKSSSNSQRYTKNPIEKKKKKKITKAFNKIKACQGFKQQERRCNYQQKPKKRKKAKGP